MGKKSILKKTTYYVYLFSAVLFLIIAGCSPDPFFVPVVFIDGVPETGTAGIPLTLSGTVSPAFASNKQIVWLLDGDGNTGASLNGNILNTLAKGTVVIKARVANGIAEGKDYNQYFFIEISENFEDEKAYADISITFAQITDNAPTIMGPTLKISGTVAEKKAIITIDGSGYSDIKWEITGTNYSGKPGITQTGGLSFTLDATDVRYSKSGEHHLTLTLTKDGVPYNKTIIFTIIP